MSYLIFENESTAVARNEEAAIVAGLAYHKGHSGGTRYVWGLRVEQLVDSPRVALAINGYEQGLLTNNEVAELVDVLPPDWRGYEDDQV